MGLLRRPTPGDSRGRTIGPALRAGRAFARDRRRPTCGYAAISAFSTYVIRSRPSEHERKGRRPGRSGSSTPEAGRFRCRRPARADPHGPRRPARRPRRSPARVAGDRQRRRGNAVGILLHGGPLLVELLGRCSTPTTRPSQAETATLTSTGTGRGPPWSPVGQCGTARRGCRRWPKPHPCQPPRETNPVAEWLP